MKSSDGISLEHFKALWYYGEPIDPDAIEDSRLKELYVSLLAMSADYEEAYEAIEEYIGGRSIIHEAGNAYVEQQPDERGPRLPN